MTVTTQRRYRQARGRHTKTVTTQRYRQARGIHTETVTTQRRYRQAKGRHTMTVTTQRRYRQARGRHTKTVTTQRYRQARGIHTETVTTQRRYRQAKGRHTMTVTTQRRYRQARGRHTKTVTTQRRSRQARGRRTKAVTTKKVSNLVIYAQSTNAFILGQSLLREDTDNQEEDAPRLSLLREDADNQEEDVPRLSLLREDTLLRDDTDNQEEDVPRLSLLMVGHDVMWGWCVWIPLVSESIPPSSPSWAAVSTLARHRRKSLKEMRVWSDMPNSCWISDTESSKLSCLHMNTKSSLKHTSYRAILKSHHHFNSLCIWTQSPPWNTNVTVQSSSPIITSKAYTWTQSPPWNTQVTVQSLSPIVTSTAYTWTQSPPWNRLQCNPLQQLTHEHKVLPEAQLTVPSSFQQLTHEQKVLPETHRLQCSPQVPPSLQQYTPIIPFGFTLEFVACQSVEFRSLNLYINMHQRHNGACQCTEFVTVGEGEARTATA